LSFIVWVIDPISSILEKYLNEKFVYELGKTFDERLIII